MVGVRDESSRARAASSGRTLTYGALKVLGIRPWDSPAATVFFLAPLAALHTGVWPFLKSSPKR